MRHRRTEAVLLLVHTVATYLGVVFAVLPPGKALAFIAIHKGLWGVYMGMSFAPNHKGMPVLTAEDELDFLRKQVLTSRNVVGGRWVDVALGGLNYQIEHHLFPSMPRANLRRARADRQGSTAPSRASRTRRPGWSTRTGQALRHMHASVTPRTGLTGGMAGGFAADRYLTPRIWSSDSGASTMSAAGGAATVTGVPKSEYVVFIVPSWRRSLLRSMVSVVSRPWSSTVAVNGTALPLPPSRSTETPLPATLVRSSVPL